jgi:peptide/nickel transport system permease protein
MISDGRDFLRTAPWISIFPGLAIGLVVLGFNLFGDGLRDAMDPRLRGRLRRAMPRTE